MLKIIIKQLKNIFYKPIFEVADKKIANPKQIFIGRAMFYTPKNQEEFRKSDKLFWDTIIDDKK